MKGKGFNEKRRSSYSGFWGKLFVAFLFSIVLSVNPSVQAEGELSTIYHVYVGDDYIGAVDKKEMVESEIEELVEKAEKKHERMKLTTSKEVSFIAEKLFEPSNNNDEVTDKINKELTIQAKVFTVEADGDVVAYLPSKEKAEETIHQFKLEYMDESTLKEAESNMKNEKNPEVKKGDPAVVDISLSKEISHSKAKVNPEKVSTVEEAVELLKSGKKVEKEHTVEKGDTISEITSEYDLTEEKFMQLNHNIESSDDLEVNETLKVTEQRPYLEVIVKEEEIKEASIAHDTETKRTDDLYEGETKVEQKGEDGKKEIHYSVTKVNGETTETKKLDEKTVKEPVKEIILKGTKEKPAQGDGIFSWPAVGGTITSKMGPRWGESHDGIDIAGVSDRTIKAADGGVVTYAQFNNGGYGNQVKIDHKNGYVTTYSHMSSLSVSKGQKVAAGDKIGVMGTTGQSTGVHLHFEVHKNGSPVNPLSYVSK
ncbi:M23 family metallopeptidase [Thalassobacillus devorans]|uniref:M23 family metallopeptidase n=1 Tax=Thalassobacillus devorans TaxID=279813 RepID=UPI0004AE116C|nr:M23 family metallopeptidase [Thalassobacillus devorans]